MVNVTPEEVKVVEEEVVEEREGEGKLRTKEVNM